MIPGTDPVVSQCESPEIDLSRGGPALAYFPGRKCQRNRPFDNVKEPSPDRQRQRKVSKEPSP